MPRPALARYITPQNPKPVAPEPPSHGENDAREGRHEPSSHRSSPGRQPAPDGAYTPEDDDQNPAGHPPGEVPRRDKKNTRRKSLPV